MLIELRTHAFNTMPADHAAAIWTRRFKLALLGMHKSRMPPATLYFDWGVLMHSAGYLLEALKSSLKNLHLVRPGPLHPVNVTLQPASIQPCISALHAVVIAAWYGTSSRT